MLAEHGTSAAAILVDGWKLLQGRADDGYTAAQGFPGLYRVDVDPAERTDRSRQDQAVVHELSELLERFRSQHPRVGRGNELERALDPGVLEELRELGYLGDG